MSGARKEKHEKGFWRHDNKTELEIPMGTATTRLP